MNVFYFVIRFKYDLTVLYMRNILDLSKAYLITIFCK